MSRPIIEVRGLSKRYRLGAIGATSLREEVHRTLDRLRGIPHPDDKEFWALKDVSFDVQPGEVVGVIGRNGAGKSTLLKILSRITEPTSGTARLRGRVASLLEVGTGFHPELTGRENVFLNGAILGMTRAEVRAKFDEIVAFAEVEKFIDTPVKRYSSGMYVRLAFAVAAHLEPEILIIDEVLAVGDAQFQKKCLGKMEAVAAGDGRTVLFVSHNMGAMCSLCARALWLDAGRLKAVGPTRAIVDDYLRASGQTARSSFTLPATRAVPGVGSRLLITGVEFNRGGDLMHGEPLELAITFRTTAPVSGVSIGLGFGNLEGTRLLTMESDLGGTRHDYPVPGEHRLVARVSAVPLQPGLYAIDVGARSGDFNALDYLPGCALVEVLPGPQTPGTIIRDNPHVRLPANWS